MSFINWGNESPEQIAIRRQIEQQALFEQAARVRAMRAGNAPGVGGGSKKADPRAKVVAAQSALVWYYDNITDDLKIFMANYDNFSFSEEVSLGYTRTQIDGSPSRRELVSGRGWILRIRLDSDGSYIFYFIDAGGNVVDTVNTGTSSRNDNSFEGYVSLLSYTDPATNLVTLKWWGGDTVYTRTFQNVDGQTVTFDYVNEDACSDDGTFTVYYYDTALNKTRIYAMNAYTGAVREITALLEHPTLERNYIGLHGEGNFFVAEFRASRNEEGFLSFNEGDSFVTLTEPNPNIFPGDEITATNIPVSTYIIEVDGTTVWLSQPTVDGGSEGGNYYTNSNRLELVRIINTDGTYTDYDFGTYNVWGVEDRAFFGTDKLVYYLYTQTNQLPWSLLTYSHAAPGFFGAQIDTKKYPNWAGSWDGLDPFDNSYASPRGSESMLYVFYDTNTSDSKMQQLSPVKFFWNNATTAELYSYEPVIGITSYTGLDSNLGAYTQGTYTGILSTSEGPGSGATFNITVNSNGDIATLTINNAGVGYGLGDVIKIAGTAIGGESPGDDVTLVVDGLEEFSIYDLYPYKSIPTLLYVSSVGSDDVEILSLNQDGTYSLNTTPTLYADCGNYFQIRPLGDDFTLFTHYDNSRVSPDNDIQFFGVWNNSAGQFTGGTNIWTTTNNNWGTNYDTFYMLDNGNDYTWWFNSSLGNQDEIIQAIEGAAAYDEALRADSNDGGDYVNYHQTGTTLFLMPDDTAYLLSSDNTPPASLDLDLPLGTLVNGTIRLNKTHVYNLTIAEGGEIYVQVYDLEGSLVNTLATGVFAYSEFSVWNDRALLYWNNAGEITFWMVSPTGFATKTISENGWNLYYNSWYWWNNI